ncbi:MAG: nucleotide exchange factor GrpE [Desulfobacteria bacterium]
MRERKRKPRSGKPDHREIAEKEKRDASRKAKKAVAEEESVEERLKASEAKAEENRDRLLRVTAEFENYKKRAERDINDFRKFANESLIKEILPIVDNLERALEISDGDDEKTSDSMREGVEMTLEGLLNTLKKYGVVPIESLEKPFDPNFHQAVMQEESDKHPDNTVSQELQKGYMMQDRLLRPAMVVVSKKPASKPDAKLESSEDAHKVDVTVL